MLVAHKVVRRTTHVLLCMLGSCRLVSFHLAMRRERPCPYRIVVQYMHGTKSESLKRCRAHGFMHVRTSYVCQTLMKTTSPEPSCELDPLQVLGLPDLSYLQEGISRRPLYRIRVFSRNCKIAAVTGVYQEVESVSCNTKAAKTGLLGEDLRCQRMHQLVVLLVVLFSSAFVHVPASCGRPLRIAAICLTTLDWLSKGAEEKRWR